MANDKKTIEKKGRLKDSLLFGVFYLNHSVLALIVAARVWCESVFIVTLIVLFFII